MLHGLRQNNYEAGAIQITTLNCLPLRMKGGTLGREQAGTHGVCQYRVEMSPEEEMGVEASHGEATSVYLTCE